MPTKSTVGGRSTGRGGRTATEERRTTVGSGDEKPSPNHGQSCELWCALLQSSAPGGKTTFDMASKERATIESRKQEKQTWIQGLLARIDRGQGVRPGSVEDQRAVEFARVIRDKRVELNLDVQDVAALSGMSKYSLIEIENGLTNPANIYTEWVAGLAKTLDLGEDDLRETLTGTPPRRQRGSSRRRGSRRRNN